MPSGNQMLKNSTSSKKQKKNKNKNQKGSVSQRDEGLGDFCVLNDHLIITILYVHIFSFFLSYYFFFFLFFFVESESLFIFYFLFLKQELSAKDLAILSSVR